MTEKGRKRNENRMFPKSLNSSCEQYQKKKIKKKIIKQKKKERRKSEEKKHSILLTILHLL